MVSSSAESTQGGILTEDPTSVVDDVHHEAGNIQLSDLSLSTTADCHGQQSINSDANSIPENDTIELGSQEETSWFTKTRMSIYRDITLVFAAIGSLLFQILQYFASVSSTSAQTSTAQSTPPSETARKPPLEKEEEKVTGQILPKRTSEPPPGSQPSLPSSYSTGFAKSSQEFNNGASIDQVGQIYSLQARGLNPNVAYRASNLQPFYHQSNIGVQSSYPMNQPAHQGTSISSSPTSMPLSSQPTSSSQPPVPTTLIQNRSGESSRGKYQATTAYTPPLPVHNQSTPVSNLTGPALNQTTPAYNLTSPVFNQTTPAYNLKNTAFNQTTPAYNLTSTVFNETTPAYNLTNPTFNQTTPAYNLTQPTPTRTQNEATLAKPRTSPSSTDAASSTSRRRPRGQLGT